MSPLSEPVAKQRNTPGRGLAATIRPRRTLPDGEVLAASLPWYVVHTKVRQEQTARENLARQGYTVYLPRIKRLKRICGRQQAQMEPLFPRYLFMQPGSSAHSIAPVRSTLGVASIVRYGQEPAVMRPEILSSIADFEARWNQSGDDEISPFRRGELVRVVAGPLSGLEGLISGVSQERVIVLMQLLGADTRVSMSHHQLLVVN